MEGGNTQRRKISKEMRCEPLLLTMSWTLTDAISWDHTKDFPSFFWIHQWYPHTTKGGPETNGMAVLFVKLWDNVQFQNLALVHKWIEAYPCFLWYVSSMFLSECCWSLLIQEIETIHPSTYDRVRFKQACLRYGFNTFAWESILCDLNEILWPHSNILNEL